MDIIQHLGIKILMFLLQILNGLFEIFGFLTGLEPGTKSTWNEATGTVITTEVPIEQFFLNSPKIMNIFFLLLGISFILLAVILAAVAFKAMIGSPSGKDGVKDPIKAFGQGLYSIFTTMFSILFVVIGIVFSNFLLRT
ncbi:MAG: hypothetical protein LBV51_03125, partial [Acholeplasmatales bacterium]|nr:hypothetical protein [Acholeplasmatales bacterium]